MSKLAVFAVAALLPIASFADQTVLLRDGSRFSGTLVRADENTVTIRDNNGERRNFDVRQIQSIDFNRLDNNYDRPNGARPDGDRSNVYPDQRPNGAYPPPNSYPPAGADRAYADRDRDRDRNRSRGYMTLPTGTEIAVRTNESINAQDANSGRNYRAQIDRDVLDANNNVIIPRGSDAELTVRSTGNRELALDLASITFNGQRYSVDTEAITQQGQSKDGVGANKRTGEYVGGGAVLGTLLGAIAGGGRGAAIGALAGGAAGAGAQVLTRGSQVRVPSETVLNFRLDNPLSLNPGR